MKRTLALGTVFLLVGIPCLLAAAPAAANPRDHGDPYQICRNRGLSAAEFNRCISDVYVEELRRAQTVDELELALRGRPSSECSPDARDYPCVFNPATGRYQQCYQMAAGDQCAQYAGPCVP